MIYTQEELIHFGKGVVIIRSHGVAKEIYKILEERGLICVDATCPFVKKIHRIVERESRDGKHIIIIGDELHPEVQGIKGWAENGVTVIKTVEDAQKFQVSRCKNVCCIANDI